MQGCGRNASSVPITLTLMGLRQGAREWGLWGGTVMGLRQDGSGSSGRPLGSHRLIVSDKHSFGV